MVHLFVVMIDWKISIFGLWRHVLGQQLTKNGEKSQKQHFFKNLFHFMYTEGFEVVFPVNGSLIDDKNVHEDLKMKILLETILR